MEEIYQITTDYFCAAVIVEDGVVIRAAPILKWTLNKQFATIKFKSNYQIEKIL